MAVTTMTQQGQKSRQVALTLAVLFGLGGVDRFYLGKIWTGLLKLVTLGGLGVWWALDAIHIARNNVSDAQGMPLGENGSIQVAKSVWAEWIVVGVVLTVAILGILWGIATLTGDSASVTDFPKGVTMPLGGWIDDGVDYLSTGWRYDASRAFSGRLLQFLVRIERFLMWLPWWTVVAATALVTWRTAGWKVALVALGGLLFIGAAQLWDEGMETLALMIVATLIAVGIGIPIGVAAAKNDMADTAIRPVLDAMQTMPSFVYLIPALMLFGLGKVPAVIATVIYAVPPAIRLTSLGIRLVDHEVVEAARSFGTTSSQLLLKVQLPLALPNIMAGVNQTIMMALAMVIVASLVGAGGLGAEVLKGIARLEVGTGFTAGFSVVIMAIIIDRITQGLAKSRRVGSRE